MVSVLIYLIWIFSTKYRFNKRYVDIINKIEIAVFIIVFSIIIFICGVNESQYKFLYLFIIITTTIQYGMKQGIVVSCISSLIILAMDIFMEPNVIVNTYFENDLIRQGYLF